MKLSVSLPGEDVVFLDEYASTHSVRSRSAVVHEAIRALRFRTLDEAYTDAWSEWQAGGEAGVWDASAGDGL